MKKITTFIISIFLLLTMFAGTSIAANDLKLQVNGKLVEFEFGKPFIDNGSSLVPLRDLLVALGVKNDDKNIIWNGDEESVTAHLGNKVVKLSVGAKSIYLNDELFKELEAPAKNVDGRVYLPARAVAEAFGFSVDFDTETWTILVQEVPFGGGVKSDDFNDSTEVTSYEKQALERLSVKMKGGKLEIFDEWSVDLEVRKLKIMEYEYALPKPIVIPNKYEGGLAIELKAFVDGKGTAFAPKTGETYFIQVVTNAGEIVRMENHDPNATAKADEIILKRLKNLLGGAKFDSGKLILEFPEAPAFLIEKITIDSEYIHTPGKPISITPNSEKVELSLSQFKNATGQVFIPKREGQWSLTQGITITTNYGDVHKSASDETKSGTPACPNCQQQIDGNTGLNASDPNNFLRENQEDDAESRLNAADPSKFIEEDPVDDADSRLNTAFPSGQ